MNEDYLWDKSGEPDPQIQQLEEILGTLRYRPTPLRLPRNHFPLLAIAATIVLALVAGGLWLESRNVDASIPQVAIVTPVVTPIKADFKNNSSERVVKKRRTVMPVRQSQEALAAKQQLMFALRLASEKLNAAYRRTQGPTQIKNQHRAG